MKGPLLYLAATSVVVTALLLIPTSALSGIDNGDFEGDGPDPWKRTPGEGGIGSKPAIVNDPQPGSDYGCVGAVGHWGEGFGDDKACLLQDFTCDVHEENTRCCVSFHYRLLDLDDDETAIVVLKSASGDEVRSGKLEGIGDLSVWMSAFICLPSACGEELTIGFSIVQADAEYPDPPASDLIDGTLYIDYVESLCVQTDVTTVTPGNWTIVDVPEEPTPSFCAVTPTTPGSWGCVKALYR